MLVDGLGPRFPLEGLIDGPPVGDCFVESWDLEAAKTTVLARTRYRGVDIWRRVLRVDGAFFVIADRMHAPVDHIYTLVLAGHGGGEVSDSTFAIEADGATWTRPLASLRAVVQPTQGEAYYDSRLEEHAIGSGKWALHECLDVDATMTEHAGFLTVLLPLRVEDVAPAVASSQPEPGVAMIRLVQEARTDVFTLVAVDDGAVVETPEGSTTVARGLTHMRFDEGGCLVGTTGLPLTVPP